jgi:hypothetical protein
MSICIGDGELIYAKAMGSSFPLSSKFQLIRKNPSTQIDVRETNFDSLITSMISFSEEIFIL